MGNLVPNYKVLTPIPVCNPTSSYIGEELIDVIIVV